MATPKHFYFLCILFGFALENCSTATSRIPLLYSTSSVAIFEISDTIQLENFPEPFRESRSEWKTLTSLPNFLRGIYLKSKFLGSEDWRPLFTENQIEELGLLLAKAEWKPTGFPLLFQFRLDDPLSPNTKVLKTSFFLIEVQGIKIILFQDIQTNISFSTPYAFEDWVLFRPSKIYPRSKPELWIQSADNSGFYVNIDSSTKKRSLYGNIILEDVGIYTTEKPVKRIPSDTEYANTESKEWTDLPEKIRLLDKMYEEKLITEEEYKTKKKKLLDAF